MKTAKIQEIQWINEFTNEHWTTYYIKMKLDNNEIITLWKKNKEAFKLWDEVKYDEYTNSKWYLAWKEVKENNFKKDYKQDQRGYFTSIAFQIAFQNYKNEDDYQNCSNLARRIFADMLDNYENKQPEENGNTNKNIESPKEVKKEIEEDLPF